MHNITDTIIKSNVYKNIPDRILICDTTAVRPDMSLTVRRMELSSNKYPLSETRISEELLSLLNYNLFLTTCKEKCQKLFHV
jgi:hypothetical protein